MEHGQVGVSPLLPTDQDAPEAVHPAVGPLNNPAAGFETSLPLDRLRLFATTTDVSGVAEFLGEGPDLVVVVAFVEAQTLW